LFLADANIGRKVYVCTNLCNDCPINRGPDHYSDSKLTKRIQFVLPNTIQRSEFDCFENVVLVNNCYKALCSEIRYYYDKNIKVKAEFFSESKLDYFILYSYDKKNKRKQLSYFYPDSSLFRKEVFKNNDMPLVNKDYYKDTAVVKSIKNYDFEKNRIIEERFARNGELIHIDSTTNQISRELLLKYNPKFSKITKNSKTIKDLDFDDNGNWILREIYEFDKLKYIITRKINY
jgi:hypothetical protein